MIKNNTALETLFEKRLDEILDIIHHLLEPDDVLIDITYPEIYRFMHYFDESNNPSGSCHFVLKKTYTDFTNDEFGEEKELGIEHQKAMQELCDEIAKHHKDGFNFLGKRILDIQKAAENGEYAEEQQTQKVRKMK